MQQVDPQAACSAALLYHRMGWPRLSSLVPGQYVMPGALNRQLRSLLDHTWTLSSVDEIAAHSPTTPLSHRRFVVTFDDGYESVYRAAAPVLQELGVGALLFVVVDAIGGINSWDRAAGDVEEKIVNTEQLRELAAGGFEIGSHTLTHVRLSEMTPERLKIEVEDSKHKLEDLLSREVRCFSYPYGDYNEAVIEATRTAGYKYAFTTCLGVISADTSPLEIPRVNIRWNSIGPLLTRKLRRAVRASGLAS